MFRSFSLKGLTRAIELLWHRLTRQFSPRRRTDYWGGYYYRSTGVKWHWLNYHRSTTINDSVGRRWGAHSTSSCAKTALMWQRFIKRTWRVEACARSCVMACVWRPCVARKSALFRGVCAKCRPSWLSAREKRANRQRAQYWARRMKPLCRWAEWSTCICVNECGGWMVRRRSVRERYVKRVSFGSGH